MISIGQYAHWTSLSQTALYNAYNKTLSGARSDVTETFRSDVL